MTTTKKRNAQYKPISIDIRIRNGSNDPQELLNSCPSASLCALFRPDVVWDRGPWPDPPNELLPKPMKTIMGQTYYSVSSPRPGFSWASELHNHQDCLRKWWLNTRSMAMIVATSDRALASHLCGPLLCFDVSCWCKLCCNVCVQQIQDLILIWMSLKSAPLLFGLCTTSWYHHVILKQAKFAEKLTHSWMKPNACFYKEIIL